MGKEMAAMEEAVPVAMEVREATLVGPAMVAAPAETVQVAMVDRGAASESRRNHSSCLLLHFPLLYKSRLLGNKMCSFLLVWCGEIISLKW